MNKSIHSHSFQPEKIILTYNQQILQSIASAIYEILNNFGNILAIKKKSGDYIKMTS
jgi:hypothetical protein